MPLKDIKPIAPYYSLARAHLEEGPVALSEWGQEGSECTESYFIADKSFRKRVQHYAALAGARKSSGGIQPK